MKNKLYLFNCTRYYYFYQNDTDIYIKSLSEYILNIVNGCLTFNNIQN